MNGRFQVVPGGMMGQADRDKRGTGMSDRVPRVPAAEQHMEDISTW